MVSESGAHRCASFRSNVEAIELGVTGCTNPYNAEMNNRNKAYRRVAQSVLYIL